jgi:four helix bundle protein
LLQFLNVSKGSAGELEYELLLARDLGYLAEEDYSKLSASVSLVLKMLTGLIRSLNSQP